MESVDRQLGLADDNRDFLVAPASDLTLLGLLSPLLLIRSWEDLLASRWSLSLKSLSDALSRELGHSGSSVLLEGLSQGGVIDLLILSLKSVCLDLLLLDLVCSTSTINVMGQQLGSHRSWIGVALAVSVEGWLSKVGGKG